MTTAVIEVRETVVVSGRVSLLHVVTAYHGHIFPIHGRGVL